MRMPKEKPRQVSSRAKLVLPTKKRKWRWKKHYKVNQSEPWLIFFVKLHVVLDGKNFNLVETAIIVLYSSWSFQYTGSYFILSIQNPVVPKLDSYIWLTNKFSTKFLFLVHYSVLWSRVVPSVVIFHIFHKLYSEAFLSDRFWQNLRSKYSKSSTKCGFYRADPSTKGAALD